MSELTYMGTTYAVDKQGCLLDPEAWDENFAEGMARECEIPVLSNEHWDVIRYIRSVYEKTHVCPTVFATCKAVGLLLPDMKKLFPTASLPIAYSSLTGEGRDALLEVIERKICD